MSKDNVVQFPTSNETLDAENKVKVSTDREETLKKAFAARDQMMRSMVNDMMSLSVQLAAMNKLLTSRLGISQEEMAEAVKTEIGDVYKSMEILNTEGTDARAKLEKAKEVDVLFSPHFDALHVIDLDEALDDDGKVALAREYGLVR